MSVEFFWQLPTGGDGRHGDAGHYQRGERIAGDRAPFTAGVSDPRGDRFNYFDHLHQVARAADIAGFDGIQIRHDIDGDESWIVAGYLARSTRHLKLLTEFEAARGSAVYAAKNAISYQRYTGNRFAWQISRGGSEAPRRKLGDFVADADITTRIEEFIAVSRGVITESPFTFKGRFFEVLNGGFNGPLGGHPVPPVYLNGDSAEDFKLSAQSADVHLFDAGTPAALAPKIASLRALAAGHGRQIGIGLRIDVLARESTAEAQRDAERYLQQSGSKRDNSEAPWLWNNFATARTGAHAALVGTYDEIIEQLADYAAAGIDSFVLAAIPHFEEAYRFGEHVLPALRARIDNQHQAA